MIASHCEGLTTDSSEHNSLPSPLQVSWGDILSGSQTPTELALELDNVLTLSEEIIEFERTGQEEGRRERGSAISDEERRERGSAIREEEAGTKEIERTTNAINNDDNTAVRKKEIVRTAVVFTERVDVLATEHTSTKRDHNNNN